MTHSKYIVQAIIVNLFPDGDQSLILECLTDVLGRIYVNVQSVKKMENKHRNMIYKFSPITLECVQGKRYYRCTGVSEWKNYYQELTSLKVEERREIQSIFSMIQRLVPANIPTHEIFIVGMIFFEYILKTKFNEKQLQNMKLVVQLRILGILGYWNSDWTNEVFSIESKTFLYVKENKQSVIRLVEKILNETQMNEFTREQEL